MNEENKYFKVTAKCGHVGRSKYVPINFPVCCKNKKEAAKKVRTFARVKHNHKDAILEVVEITFEDYLELKQINHENPYLRVGSKHEQNQHPEIYEQTVVDMHNVKKQHNKIKRKERIKFMQKKNKVIIKSMEEEKTYDYFC